MAVFRKKPATTAKVNPYSYYRSTTSADSTRKNRIRDPKKIIRVVDLVTKPLSLLRVFTVLTGLALGLYLVSASTNPIVRFSTTGVNARETSNYRMEIQKVLEQSAFNRSKLLFDYRGVEKSIIDKFPEIGLVQISFDLVGRRPVIKLNTLEPAYIFRTGGLSWVIDRRGVAIGLQSELKDSFTATLQNITDEVGSVATIGSVLMSPKQIDFITSVIGVLEKQLVLVTDVYLTDSPKELDIQVSSDNWRYKLNIDEKPTGQAGTLLAARETLRLNSQTPVEYVDLRAGEKVYWK